jgi:hypothetical protein
VRKLSSDFLPGDILCQSGRVEVNVWPATRSTFPSCFLSAFPFKTAGQRNAGNTGSDSVSITGTLFTENRDHPVQQACVRLCDGGENLVEEMTTNNTGQFTFRRLRRGNYVLVVSVSDFVTNTTQMELSFGVPGDVPGDRREVSCP